MSEWSGDLVVMPPQRQIGSLFGKSLVLVALSSAVLVSGIRGWLGVGGIVAVPVGAVGLIFFSATAVYSVVRLRSSKPLLVLGRDGLIDNASGVGVGFVAWANIKDVFVTRTHGQAALTLALHDPEAVMCRLPWFKRLVVRLSQRMTGGTVSLPETVLPMPLEDVAARIQEWRRRAAEGQVG